MRGAVPAERPGPCAARSHRSDLADATPRRGRGCSECGNSGYRGRTGVFEVLPVTAAVRSVLLRTPNEAALAAAARAGNMLTLRGAGIAKARRGETTFEEVLRVTQVDLAGGRKCSSCDRAVGDDMVACPWCATTIDQGHCSACARAVGRRLEDLPVVSHAGSERCCLRRPVGRQREPAAADPRRRL